MDKHGRYVRAGGATVVVICGLFAILATGGTPPPQPKDPSFSQFRVDTGRKNSSGAVCLTGNDLFRVTFDIANSGNIPTHPTVGSGGPTLEEFRVTILLNDVTLAGFFPLLSDLPNLHGEDTFTLQSAFSGPEDHGIPTNIVVKGLITHNPNTVATGITQSSSQPISITTQIACR